MAPNRNLSSSGTPTMDCPVSEGLKEAGIALPLRKQRTALLRGPSRASDHALGLSYGQAVTLTRAVSSSDFDSTRDSRAARRAESMGFSPGAAVGGRRADASSVSASPGDDSEARAEMQGRALERGLEQLEGGEDVVAFGKMHTFRGGPRRGSIYRSQSVAWQVTTGTRPDQSEPCADVAVESTNQGQGQVPHPRAVYFRSGSVDHPCSNDTPEEELSNDDGDLYAEAEEEHLTSANAFGLTETPAAAGGGDAAAAGAAGATAGAAAILAEVENDLYEDGPSREEECNATSDQEPQGTAHVGAQVDAFPGEIPEIPEIPESPVLGPGQALSAGMVRVELGEHCAENALELQLQECHLQNSEDLVVETSAVPGVERLASVPEAAQGTEEDESAAIASSWGKRQAGTLTRRMSSPASKLNGQQLGLREDIPGRFHCIPGESQDIYQEEESSQVWDGAVVVEGKAEVAGEGKNGKQRQRTGGGLVQNSIKRGFRQNSLPSVTRPMMQKMSRKEQMQLNALPEEEEEELDDAFPLSPSTNTSLAHGDGQPPLDELARRKVGLGWGKADLGHFTIKRGVIPLPASNLSTAGTSPLLLSASLTANPGTMSLKGTRQMSLPAGFNFGPEDWGKHEEGTWTVKKREGSSASGK